MTTITTGTTGPQAWKIALVAAALGLATLVVVNLPLSTSDTTGQPAPETAALSESVTGFEYSNESTSGQAANPGVTSQYLGNSGELFPYENGPAPVQAPTGFSGPMPQATPQITQEFLDGPSSGTQGAAQVAPVPDSILDAQLRAAGTQAQSQALAASDEALVNPVPEVNAAQLIEEIIAAERPVPAPALAASDEALVSGVGEASFNSAPYVAYAEGMSEASFDGAPYIAYAEGMSEAATSGTVDWDGLGGPFQDGTVADYYAPEIAQRSPQQNVSMR